MRADFEKKKNVVDTTFKGRDEVFEKYQKGE